MYSNPADEIFNGTPKMSEASREQLLQDERVRAEEIKMLEQQQLVEKQKAATTTKKQSQQQQPSTEGSKKQGYNLGDFARDAAEMQLAIPTGVIDFGVDLINKLPSKEVPGMQNPMRPNGKVEKVPKFQNDILQTVRELSSFIVPTIFLARGGRNLGVAAQGKVGWSLGNDAAFKWFATKGLAAGAGVAVDAVNKYNEEGDNATGMLKKTWPKTYAWIPDNVATLDSDSPDIKRNKNISESLGFGLFTDVIEGAAKLAGAAAGVVRATRWVPENEKAVNFTKSLNAEKAALSNDPIENVVLQSAKKRSDDLDELGLYNFSKSANLDEPIFGLHDVYDYTESGIRSVDAGGVLAASVDVVRIAKNDDTVYGRVGSIFTESALKFGLEADDAGHSLIKGIGSQLTEAGAYGYQVSKSRYISHKEILDVGDKLAADFMGMSVEEMQRTLRPLTGVDPDTGAPVLKSEAYAGVFKAIKGYMEEFMNLDYVRAQTYVATSFAGQVSDMAEGMRLMDGTSAVERAQEQILDRMQFLMNQKGMTSYARGRALNMLNLWNRVKRGANGQSAEAMLKDEKNQTLQALARIQQESQATRDTLEAIRKDRPEMLGPLMLAYEMTDGKVNSMSRLNEYVRNSTGTISKAFFDGNSEMPSQWTQGVWSNIYNSILSSMVTPIKAGASNAVLLLERPVAMAAGAIIHRDAATLRKGWYMYSGLIDTMQKGLGHMNQVYRRAATDPSSVGYIMRDDIARKNEDQLALLNSFADASSANGMHGPAAMVTHIEALNDLSETPWFRFGPNAMTAFDGFTRSVIGNIEARGKAYDMLNKNGARIDEKAFKSIADGAYNEMFDESGMITDKAIDYASREISMNLDSPVVDGLSAMLNRAPIVKPFMMFPKTSVNMLSWAGSHNPLGVFVNDLNAFSKPFNQMEISKLEELFAIRGLQMDENAESVYSTIRAELKGRKAIGTITVASAVGLMLNDSLRGNGHYDKEKQKLRREVNWQPRTYKGWDGKWHSYENLGALSDWLALTADVMDNFDALDEPTIGTYLNKMGFILGSNITNKSFTAALEPMNDVLQGNPAALARWSASFMSSFVPGSGLRNEFSRLLTPQLKELEMDFFQLLANRNPIAKDSLPDVHDWIDGGKVGMPDSIWTRIWNTYTPWKVHDEVSPEKQFLIDVEFDARPTLRTNGKGVEYTPAQRSQVTDLMGQDGIFKKEIQRIMNTTDAKAFRKEFKDVQSRGANINVETFQNIQVELNMALRKSQRWAESRIEDREIVRQKQYINAETERQSRLGNVEEILRLSNP